MLNNAKSLKKYVINLFPDKIQLGKNRTNSFFQSVLTCLICGDTDMIPRKIGGLWYVCDCCKVVLNERSYTITMKNEDMLVSKCNKDVTIGDLNWSYNIGFKYEQLYNNIIESKKFSEGN